MTGVRVGRIGGWHRRAVAAGLAMGMLFGAAACGSRPDGARWGPGPDGPPAAAVPPQVSVTPEDGSTGATLSAEIGTRTDGEISQVKLTTKDGDTVTGRPRPDGGSWVPDRPLKPSTRYTAVVTATGADGATASARTSFTTMAAPGRRTSTGLYLSDGRTYGVRWKSVV